jgi:Ca-activated chloride channel family protein
MSRVGTLIAAASGSVVLIAVGAGLYLSGSHVRGRLTQEQALVELANDVKTIQPKEAFVTYRANVPLGAPSSLEAALPDIDRFPLNVNPPINTGDVVAEIFSSTEKAGKDTDGWLVEVAEEFNKRNIKVAGGRTAKVKVRYIPSGTAYQFIASGKYKPDAFTPSSHLWLRMVEARGVPLTPVSEKLVSNLAGIVMKSNAAAALKSATGTIDIKNLIDAVSQGKLAMGYTDPFASSTGLNFLVTVLQSFANGEEARMLSPEVESAFEVFQRGVPFVALTTIQMRESVDRDGSLDAFVMEYQTFANDQTLKSGYEFIPFGVAHDNPLYAVGQPSAEVMEVLKAFAGLAGDKVFTEQARKYGFDPPASYQAPYAPASGDLIVKAQQLWKEKKNAGRPIAAVFLCDVSGSMSGVRLKGVREALTKASAFITPTASVGMATFSDDVKILLPIRRFDINQRAALVAAAQDLREGGGTSMYDGVAVALSMLAEEQKKRPEIKPMLFVLTDGETNRGLRFDNLKGVIEGLDIPVYTIGYGTDIAELKRLAALVEAASLTADQEDIAYKLSVLFNAEM